MPSVGGTALTIGIILWLTSTLFMLFQLQTITFCMGDFYRRSDITQEQLNTIYNYVSEQYRKEQNDLTSKQSVAESTTFTLGKINSDKTVDLTISVKPHITLGTGDKLTYRIGDETAELKKDDYGLYTGTVKVSVFNPFPSGILTYEGHGDKLSEIVQNDYHFPIADINGEILPENKNVVTDDLWDNFLPFAEFMSTDAVADTSVSGQTHVNASVYIYTQPAAADPTIKFTDISLVFECNGKELRRVDVLHDSSVKKVDDNGLEYSFDETIGSENAVVFYYLIAKDTEGNTYKLYNYGIGSYYLLPLDNSRSDITVPEYNAESIIRDKDGKLIVRYSDVESNVFG